MSEDEPQALRERVAALEDRLDELTSREAGTTDQQGRQWGPTDLMQLGLSRRQAIVAFGMLAGGAALPTALRSAVETAAASDGSAVGDVGSSTNRVNVYAHVLNAEAATVGGNPMQGVWTESDASVTKDDSNDLLDINNISMSSDEVLWFKFIIDNPGSQGLYKLRFNGDGAGQSNYGTWDETGTFSGNDADIKLFDTASFAPHSGLWVLASNTGGWPAISTIPLLGRPNVINGWADTGGQDTARTISDIRIICPDGSDMSEIRIENLMKTTQL